MGISRRVKPLPAVPRCRRWQGGTETSCSCPVSGQEPRVRVRLSGSYLRGSGFGHANGVHNWSYARTPRASPRCAAQHGLGLPRPLQMQEGLRGLQSHLSPLRHLPPAQYFSIMAVLLMMPELACLASVSRCPAPLHVCFSLVGKLEYIVNANRHSQAYAAFLPTA